MAKTSKAVLFLIISLFLFTSCKQNTPNWQTFSSEEGGFTINMPGNPKEETSTYQTDAGEITIHLFGIPIGASNFIVAYSDYPTELIGSMTPEEVLASARDGAITNTKGKLLEEEAIELDGNPGLFLFVEAPDQSGVAQAKLFLVGNRLYQVFAATPEDQAASDEVAQFLSSFALLK